ncbi:nickel pincer cofactor biosynthesis protein LarC [Elusimicrobiota bacterium]
MICFDCYQGASGDMLVGALLNLDNNPAVLKNKLKKLNIKGIKIKMETVKSSSVSATRVKFSVPGMNRISSMKQLDKFLAAADISKDITNKIKKTYLIIFQAESNIHNKPADKVHLHELSSLETLIEIASFFILAGKEDIYCRKLPLGSGTLKTAHGQIPVPAPATLEILKNVPVELTENKYEMVTPTAAALLKASAKFKIPEISVKKTGYGAGKRSLLRVFKTEAVRQNEETLIQIEVNIDDMTPEDISSLAGKLLSKSKEVYITPVLMKKGRPGQLLTVLCERKKLQKIKEIIFKDSTSAGLRYWEIKRDTLPRKSVEFKSSLGRCRIKETEFPDGSIKIKPEYDDLKKISAKTDMPVYTIREKIKREYNDE